MLCERMYGIHCHTHFLACQEVVKTFHSYVGIILLTKFAIKCGYGIIVQRQIQESAKLHVIVYTPIDKFEGPEPYSGVTLKVAIYPP